MNAGITVDMSKIEEFCHRRSVRRLAVYGSMVRGDPRPESDVDVLVMFQPGRTPGFFTIFEMEEELSGYFGGRKVDLRTPEDLSRHFRDEVLQYAEVLHAEE